MKLPTRVRQHGLKFNITPLIDIVFLLIIFFLAASHLARSETSQEIELPKALPQENSEELPRRLVVTVTADEVFYLGASPVQFSELEILIKKTKTEAGEEPIEVQIRCDKQVPYSVVEPLLFACARAGVTEVRFGTSPTR